MIFGHVLSAGAGQSTARQASIAAGLPHSVPALTINKVCGSGLSAVMLGAQTIRSGDAEVIIAGGMENMSLAPYLLPKVRTDLRMGHGQVVDSVVADGLWDAFNDYHMGTTAENLASRYEISREAQDAFAAASQQKAQSAIESARVAEEITPILLPQRKGDPISFATDELPRKGTTAEALGKLKPAFQRDGRQCVEPQRWGGSRIADERQQGLCQLRSRPGTDGHRPGVRHSPVPEQGWLAGHWMSST